MQLRLYKDTRTAFGGHEGKARQKFQELGGVRALRDQLIRQGFLKAGPEVPLGRAAAFKHCSEDWRMAGRQPEADNEQQAV